jgi:hypothetical protein
LFICCDLDYVAALAALCWKSNSSSDRRPEKPGFYPECQLGEVIFSTDQRLLEPQFLSWKNILSIIVLMKNNY